MARGADKKPVPSSSTRQRRRRESTSTIGVGLGYDEEVYESGFRAQFARPLALIVHREPAHSDRVDLVKRVARAYRAEVLVVANPADVTAYCRQRELGLSPVTVARLVQKEPQESVCEPPVSQKRGRWTLKELAGGAMAVVVGIVCATFWLMVWGGIALGILGAIFGWFEDGSRSATSIARKHLAVIDQAVLGAASREPVYVVVVKNDDRRRAALDVTPRLRTRGGGEVARLAASGQFDHPANVPPGGAAVAVDRLRAVPAGRLAAPRFQVGAFRRAQRFPVERVVASLDRVACTLTAEVIASRPLDHLMLIGIARLGGRIAGGGEFRLDALPRGRSTHKLGKPGVRSCDAEPPRWSLYPALSPLRGKWRG